MNSKFLCVLLLLACLTQAVMLGVTIVNAEGEKAVEHAVTLNSTQTIQKDAGTKSETESKSKAKYRSRRNESKDDSNAQVPWLDPIRDEPNATKHQEFFSQSIQRQVSYQIYFPPEYALETAKRYPVVYWLHGLGGDQRTGARFVKMLDAAIESGDAPHMMVVLVNGLRDRFYCDSQDGKIPIESVIVKDLISEVDSAHRTIPRRESRAIEGASMGGFGALVLGLKYHETFGFVSSLMPGIHDEDSISEMYPNAFDSVYGGSQEYFKTNSPWELLEKNADVIRNRTMIRIWIGGSDRAWRRERTTKFHELLMQLNIDHEYRVISDVGHSFIPLYVKAGVDNWRFYRNAFKTN